MQWDDKKRKIQGAFGPNNGIGMDDRGKFGLVDLAGWFLNVLINY